MSHDIEYSKKYSDSLYEYRHVILPKEVAKRLQDPPKLLSETEWRALGVQQSLGWVHYEIHKPEPHILLFRRPLGTDPRTGQSEGGGSSGATVGGGGGASQNILPQQQQEQKQPQQQQPTVLQQPVVANQKKELQNE